MIRWFLATELGWLRRPELDQFHLGRVWEKPSGQLYVARTAEEPRESRLIPPQRKDFIR